ncbi:nucleotidyltransferase family protein [Sphingorhabdus sp. Alg239-R122]|uniref:nucleotidyltransferase family protein n=1 Tax=Sphingorhabdus sp. Alg239-R122 TaxID=2305989 RepID=UPI0013DBDCFC|nr:nucleotidyltransferase family protein [Sphingorhabdus sp. Alg239-R122]
MTDAATQVIAILRADPRRWQLLGVVSELGLPDCWIGAGFVRNAVWDHLHQRTISPIRGDIDVIWYDPGQTDPTEDRRHEAALLSVEPTIAWSVKNQARMHDRNADLPYTSATDAMRYWPETATAVAARHLGDDSCEVAAPIGLKDLFGLILRPTPRFADEKHDIYVERLKTKGWLNNWPLLREV